MFALHKQRARSDPNNYRGIHLTAQLSKAMERLMARQFQPYLEASLAYGANQFAYTAARGSKDALALNVLTWLHHMSNGKQVGLFCADVAGAFDRVSSLRLCSKLQQLGLHHKLLPVLESWLNDRSFVVIVDGVESPSFPLKNSVYQGTVLGPILWNCHYADASKAVTSLGFTDSVYADDLICFKAFDRFEMQDDILHELSECQCQLHKWGTANQVTFEPSKETFHILHNRRPMGDDFLLLGVHFDTRLVMNKAIAQIAARAHLEVDAI